MGNKGTREKWVDTEFKAAIALKVQQNVPTSDYQFVDQNGTTLQFLTLSDMIKFKQPRNADIQLDSTHLGTLFMIDQNKDGRFTRDEIVEFVHEYFARQTANPNTVDVVKEFQGYCTANLWNYVYKGEDNPKGTQEGKEKFGNWFEKLFSYGNLVDVNGNKTEFVDRGAVKRMHEVLNISKSYAIEQNQTFALLLDVAKSKGFMKAVNRTDVIPVKVLKLFGIQFIEGFINYMKELSFEHSMEIK